MIHFLNTHDLTSNTQGANTEQLNTDRSQHLKHNLAFLEEKLRKADELLRDSAIEIKNLREEREQIRLESDRLRL